MHQLFVCLWWSQIGFQHIAAIEFGGFLLCTCLDGQRDGALLYGQRDPVSDAQGFGTGHELLYRTLGLGTRMVSEVWVLLGDLGLERRQFRVPRVPHFLSTHGMTPQHVSDTLLGEPLGQ